MAAFVLAENVAFHIPAVSSATRLDGQEVEDALHALLGGAGAGLEPARLAAAFIVCSAAGDLEGVEAALAAACDVRAQDALALRRACQFGQTAVVSCLLAHGGWTQRDLNAALVRAAGGVCVELVQLLLDWGADAAHSSGMAFRMAVACARWGCAHRLKQAGATNSPAAMALCATPHVARMLGIQDQHEQPR